MSPKDKVRLEFWSDGLHFDMITSREQAQAFKMSWMGVTGGKIEVSGTINDIDGNDIALSFDTEKISGIQIMEINHT